MERTPPRRSARLMSIVAISTNSTMPIVSTSGGITTTAQAPLEDGAPSIVSVRNAADTAQVSRKSTEDKPTSHNIDDIEKRLAMLEPTLKALVGSSNSTVTYTSSAVTQSQSTQPAQLAPPQSVPTYFEALSASRY